MGKFVIECPNCGKYAEAKTGFFARKKIDCTCGYTINVRTDRISSKICPHCGNTVVYDQSKGENAKCPVCNSLINTVEGLKNLVQFTCPNCACELSANKSATSYICPLCDTQIDVQERIAKEEIKKQGLASVIKYEGANDVFVWKHPIEDFNYGSQLIVHESQEAILFRDGQALDLFGPGRYTLETEQLPVLNKAYNLPTNVNAFHTEVYFINKTVQMSLKWGTPDKIRFIDPLTGVPLEIGASGEMAMQVSNSRKLLIKLVGTTGGVAWDDGSKFTSSIQTSFRPVIASAVRTSLPAIIKSEAIDLLEIDEKLEQISAVLKDKISPVFDDYGLSIPHFFINRVVLPEDDPNFKRIKELHSLTLQTRMFQADATLKVAQAQNETLYRTAQEQSKATIEAAHRDAEMQRQMTQNEIARMEAERQLMKAQADAQAKRMDGLADAEIMQAKGYTQRDLINADVQKTYAENLGNMNFGGSSGGSGIVGEMMNLGIGMSAVNSMMPKFESMFNGMNGMGRMDFQNQMPEMNPNPINSIGAMNTVSTWDCTCGNRGITGNFCNNCGARKPEIQNTWDCSCGNRGIIGNFCNNCGARRPESQDTWDCSCGNKGIIGNFCNNCGARRPESQNTWDCKCGNKGIMGRFCNNCGSERGNN